MKKIFISAILLMLVIVPICLVNYAHAVPTLAEEQEVITYLKNQNHCKSQDMKFSIESVNIGPGKPGLTGSCTYGGGIFIIFEKTSHGLVKRLQLDLGMNSNYWLSKRDNMGYYNITVSHRSGSKVYNITYKWNGNSYYEVDEKKEQLSSYVKRRSNKLKNLEVKIIYSRESIRTAKQIEERLKNNGARSYSNENDTDYESIKNFAGKLYYYYASDKGNAYKVTNIIKDILTITPSYDGNDPTIAAKQGELTLWVITSHKK
jgi:hypothetical protein